MKDDNQRGLESDVARLKWEVAKLTEQMKKLEAERLKLYDDARYAGLLRRFIKENQWGGVFLVMRNYFGLDHIGIPPGMEEVVAENARLQDQLSDRMMKGDAS